MNDEIREILNYLDMYKNMNEGLLNSKDKKLLLDYITNLQQDLANYVNVILHDRNVIDEYKLKVEKAIKLINKRKDEVNEVNELLWIEMRTKDYFAEYDELLNILQNGSDEE